MRWRILFAGLALAGIFITLPAPLLLAHAQEAELSPGDRQFLALQEAFKTGKHAQVEALGKELQSQDHALADYAEYYLLLQGLSKREAKEVLMFIERQGGNYLGERLRTDWLRVQAQRGAWQEAQRQFAQLAAPSQESRCLSLLARIHLRDAPALEEARSQWLTLTDTSGGCQSLLNELDGRVTSDQRWARVRFLFELNRLPQARQMMANMPPSQRPDAKELDQMLNKTPAWLTRLAPESLKNRSTQEMLVLAIQRLARNDPTFAAGRLEHWGQHLSEDARAWAWGQIALQGALRHMNAAAGWFRRSRPAQLSYDGAEWRVRVALRQKNWDAVRIAIESMPAELKEKPEWIYWLSRAHKDKGRIKEAHAGFARIAGQPHFYSNMADEELGHSVRLPPQAPPVSANELASVQVNAGLLRALTFFRLGLRLEGIREWNWAVRDMNDRQLLAAAEFARQQQLYDRAIYTAEKTRDQHNYELRFLAPFLDQVRPAAGKQSLDDAWVYGLMRQESRFVISAKSSVGAAGLMQLMPATARWVAREIGFKDYNPRQVTDPETNLLLGTSYMRMVLEGLDNHPVLASAAYNAGPSRARRWRAATSLEGAIYAETIPFNETRDYVKRVMSNTVYYSLLFNGRSPPLHNRMGTIPARSANEKPLNLL
jgi:soluble lytic murein transglycosylase